MKLHLLFAFSASLVVQQLDAQVLSSSISNWKNGAAGAYSIIHDDYGNVGVDGIWQYADTIAYNRGLKFTFGAISGDCEVNRNINGFSSPYAYAKDVMMALHDHEIINHSHTHSCAINRGWSPCNATGWGEIQNTAALNTELNTSHNSITNGTVFQPRYFIFPYDQFTDLANIELANKGYIGSRTGWHVDGFHNPFYKFGYEENDENLFRCQSDGFFRTSVQVFDDNDAGLSTAAQTAVLNSVVDAAIANNEWGNRELHNVGWSGWGHVKVTAYRDHLNYVQSKVNSGELWMPTVSEMLTYQIQKLVYIPASAYNGTDKKITTTFSEDHSIYSGNVASYLSPLTIKVPVTVEIDVAAYTGLIDFQNAVIKQGAQTITDFVLKNNKLYVNLYPHEGSFTIQDPDDVVSAPVYTLDDFEVFPNPSAGIVNVSGPVTQLQLFSSTGELLIESSEAKIDLQRFPQGVYFLSINASSAWVKVVKR